MLREFDDVTVEGSDEVAIIRLNAPETLNAVSTKMMRGLKRALDFAQVPGQGYRCVILTGTGRGFCSGANLTTRGPDDILRQDDLGEALRGACYPVLRQLRELSIPVVCAINGPAVGFGFSLAIMGDIAIAARSAFFQLAFSRIGLVPDGAAAWMLSRIIGAARTRELVLLAERLDAQKALDWGLISRVYDDAELLDGAMLIARELSTRPADSLPLIRQCYWDGFDNTHEQQLELEAGLQSLAGHSAEFAEGVIAFREKRQPIFRQKQSLTAG